MEDYQTFIKAAPGDHKPTNLMVISWDQQPGQSMQRYQLSMGYTNDTVRGVWLPTMDKFRSEWFAANSNLVMKSVQLEQWLSGIVFNVWHTDVYTKGFGIYTGKRVGMKGHVFKSAAHLQAAVNSGFQNVLLGMKKKLANAGIHSVSMQQTGPATMMMSTCHDDGKLLFFYILFFFL